MTHPRALALAGLASLVGVTGVLTACVRPGSLVDQQPAGQATEAPAATPTADTPAAPAANPDRGDPRAAQVLRLRGGPELAVRSVGDDYVSGPCRITTPLPDGYPAPTAPGAIELKRYPSVRRAEVSGVASPDLGMNIAFFPLFQHIKERNIPMTSPVEMNFERRPAAPAAAGPEGELEPQGGEPGAWTMSFLYRSKDQGPTGPDGRRRNVRVVDVAPVTVIALGVRGPQGFGRMSDRLSELQAYLAGQSVLEAAGEPRGLYYNGPDVRDADKWGEVQIPVRLIAPSLLSAPGPAEPGEPPTK